jgi:hypothetical protein
MASLFCCSCGLLDLEPLAIGGESVLNILLTHPFVLQLLSHYLHLQLDLPLAVVLQDVLVGLALDGTALAVSGGVQPLWRATQVELVALDVAAGSRAPGGEQADSCGCWSSVED